MCRSCGKSLSALAQPAAHPNVAGSQGRVAQHVQLLGGLWIVVSVLILLGGIALLTIANSLLAATAERGWGVSAGQGRFRIRRRTGIDAAAALGPAAGAHPRIRGVDLC